ncbi:MAG TPA: DUF5011 domain-containing protein [Tenericutes bacterium]|nr:DUF5011 domain-containing protein [Mycoplasmatota bacterium]
MKKHKKTLLYILISIPPVLGFLALILLWTSSTLDNIIDPFLKVTTTLTISIIFTILVLIGINFIKTNDMLKLAINVAISAFLAIFILYAGKAIYDFENTLKNITKKGYEYYSTAFVVRSNSNITSLLDLNNKKLGLLNDETSYEGYIIPKEEIEANEINANIDYENTFLNLISELLNGTYDAIVLPETYKEAFDFEEELSESLENLKTIYTKSKEVKKEQTETKPIVKGEPFSIVLIGTDKKIVGNRTDGQNYDVILLITVNPKTSDVLITSINRDTYVKSKCLNGYDRINHSGWAFGNPGAECLLSTIREFFGIDVHYYAMVDFKGMVNIVDAIGGIKIDVPKAFCEQDSNRKKGRICLKAGHQKLNGEQALAFARHRKTTSSTVRSQNHVVVIKAIAEQLVSVNLVKNYSKLLNIAEKNVLTNLNEEQMMQLYEIGMDWLKTSNYNVNNLRIENVVIKTSGSIWGYSANLNYPVYMVIPYQNHYERAVNLINTVLEAKTPTISKYLSFDLKKPFSFPDGPLQPREPDPRVITKNFVGRPESDVRYWDTKFMHNFWVTYEYEYHDTIPNGYVISQEFPVGTKLNYRTGMKVVISLGKKSDYISVKDLVKNLTGKTIQQIKGYLNNLGLKHRFEKVTDVEDPNVLHNTFIDIDKKTKAKKVIYKPEHKDETIVYIAFKGTEEMKTTKPIIELYGNPEITLEYGSTWNDPGCYYFHEFYWYDLDFTKVITNEDGIAIGIDTKTPGTYIITYTVTTKDGVISDPVKRTVIVKEKEEEQETSDPIDENQTEPSENNEDENQTEPSENNEDENPSEEGEE